MAQITGGATKYRPAPPRIDMTPMVDLGFLLISFFIFTTTLSAYSGFALYMPADGPPTKLGQSTALTFIIGADDKLCWYEGDFKTAQYKVQNTTYNVASGAGAIIRQKQKTLVPKQKELMLLIKPTDEASYKNLLALLDEVLINNVKKYAIATPAIEEKIAVLQQ